MIACYILYTPSFNKFYVGATQEDVYTRLLKHNTKVYDKPFTAFTSDWEIFLFVECSSYSQAINIERHIKRIKSKDYIKNLKRYPEILEKLLLKYS